MEVPAASEVCGAEYELVRLALADGYEGWGRWLVPGGAGAGSGPGAVKRAVLYLHGIQSHGGWFLESMAWLRARGMAVLGPERRGSGLNERERGHCKSAGQLLEDVDRCVEWLRSKTGVERVDIVGVSWSGKLALVYAARQGAKVRSVALVTPGLRARVDISLREKIAIGAEGLVNPRRLHEIPLQEGRLFTANRAKLRFIAGDPLKLMAATASFFLTSRHFDATVPKVLDKLTMPVYLFLAERDQIIANEATVKLLRSVLRPVVTGAGEQVAVQVYGGAEHTLDFEAEPGGYFADLAATLAG